MIAGPGRGTRPADRRAWLRAALAVAAAGWGAQEFTPLLLLYQARLGLSATMVQATFVPYVIGLMPGLLFGGPFSDRYGRRSVMMPTMIVSALATVLLIVGAGGYDLLLAGRLLAGVASGAAFSCGAAWIKELSVVDASSGIGHGPRRLTVAMGVGFGLGPLVAGALAQWAPMPTVLPYVPHLILTVAALLLVLRTRETLAPNAHASLMRNLRIGEVRGRRFLTVVMPLAPWVFIVVAIAVGYLPDLIQHQIASWPLIFSALVVAANAGAGIFVQPFAKWVDRLGRARLLATAMSIVVVGTLIAAGAATLAQPELVLVASLVLGAAYGCCQVYGLLEVQRLARPDHLAGLTATYQALTYIGFMASYPLAAIGEFVPAGILLVAVAVLAALTLVFTTRSAALTAADSCQPEAEPALVEPAA